MIVTLYILSGVDAIHNFKWVEIIQILQKGLPTILTYCLFNFFIFLKKWYLLSL